MSNHRIHHEGTPVQAPQQHGRITGIEYRSALFAELEADSAANIGDPTGQIPPRIYAIIRRAFERAHAGEFQA